ncbi:MAG: hypothetical protein IKL04_00030 [Lachnospiraceae bacterium]|nr:hypothetical protein [Lachnospiraceae bacterium]
MGAKEVYFKTIKFVWLKLALGGALVLFSLITFAITMAIAVWTNLAFLLYFWIIFDLVVCIWVSRYMGYMLKAGHVAVVSTAVATGQVPEKVFETGKDLVTRRFGTSNVYFVVDGLVSGAVSQLQKGLQTVDRIFGNIPGISAVVSFLQLFVKIALGYVDECCLGYTFIHPEQSAFKSAADGVVIYFQNWKKLLKNAALTAVIVIGLSFAAFLVPFLVLVPIFKAIEAPTFIAFLLALLIAWVLKSAFVDSFMMVKMMVSYMEVAPATEITFDLYGKLCKLSAKFKELFNKGQTQAA